MTKQPETIAEAQAACDRLAVMMAERGLERPEAQFEITSGRATRVWLKATTFGAAHDGRSLKRFDNLASAEAWIGGIPSVAERHLAEFLRMAGDTADYAAKHLPDDEIAERVRASIVSEMRRLSESAITAA